MKIFQTTHDFKPAKKTVLTIGTFDGVHIGHCQIITKILETACNSDLESVILTFFPHPRMVLNHNNDVKLLNTIAEKSSLLAFHGIENLIIQKFDNDFANLSAEDFVKQVLVEQLNIQKIIIGHDHRFGKNRAAGIADLIGFGQKYDFEVAQISAQTINDISISSTKIRTALNNGNVQLANSYLGYNYELTGTVVHGKKIGRTIGFPTANISIACQYKLIPNNGVYVVKCMIDNKIVFGVMNIGTKPTFNEQKMSIEVHFIDFEADLYKQILTISILTYIRNEQKFDAIEALKKQIELDKKAAVDYLKNYIR